MTTLRSRETPRRHAATALFALLVLLSAQLLLPLPAIAGDKTDVIYLRNGDRVTGEIKEMLQGQLRLDTVSMGVILVKWTDIDHIESTKYIQTEMLDGTRHFGQVPASQQSGVLSVSSASGAITELDHDLIARMEPIKIKPSFWEKLDNTLSLGFTYTKASDVLQWNIAASTEYRTRQFSTALSFDSMITDNGGANNLTRRADLSIDHYRFRPNRWFAFGSGSVQTNDELGIDRRFLATVGMGRYVWQRQTSELIAGLGLAGNLESSIGDQTQTATDKTNLEGLVQVNWSFFKLHTPKSSMNFVMKFYPGITDTSRNRANLDVRLRQEFIKDLFLSLSLYGAYDSKPPSGAIAREDYGIVTSLEYEF